MLHYSGLSVQFTQSLDAAIQIFFERGCRRLWNDAIHCNSVIPVHDNKGFFLYLGLVSYFLLKASEQTGQTGYFIIAANWGLFKKLRNNPLSVAETKLKSVFTLLEEEAPLQGALDEQRRLGSNQRRVEELCCCCD